MAADYAARKGLVLDETLNLSDAGVSAYRGANLATGALGYFKEAVDAGEVPQGSFLLVESLDRISRQDARRAQRTLEDIIDAGVVVVTLTDGREYSQASIDRDPFELMVSLLTFIRANEESATKSRRLKSAWETKRSTISERPMTARTPGWIRLDPATRTLELIPERAAIVRQICLWVAEGRSQTSIAQRLTAEGLEPWGRGKVWHRSYIAKILTNPATIGTYGLERHSIVRTGDGTLIDITLPDPHYFLQHEGCQVTFDALGKNGRNQVFWSQLGIK